MNMRWKTALPALGLSLALIAAACAPGGAELTPGATLPMATEPLATEPLATQPLATEPMPATEQATAALTDEPLTPQPTAGATTAPDMRGEPSVFLSSELVGSMVVDNQDEFVGDVLEILVDEAGAIQYVVLDASIYLAGALPAATQDPLTPNPALLNAGIVAVPFSQFEVYTAKSTDAEPVNERKVLVYTGTAADLEAMGGFDLAGLGQPGFVIDTTGTTLDAAFDGLIRVSQATRANITGPNGENLAGIGDMIIDVSQQAVQFSLVEFGGFLGIGAQAVAVPWDSLILDMTGTLPAFRLEVEAETLEGAPRLDVRQWPAWPERVESNTEWNLNWQDEVRNFWEGAASS